MKNKILLPGLDKQIEFLKNNYNEKPKSILVIGSSSEVAALSLSGLFHISVNLIVEEYESLMSSKLILKNKENIILKMMSFETTDFNSSEFDLVFAQASISSVNRNKIIKEIKRILKPGGFFCAGEIVSITSELPRFMTDIYEASDLLPLHVDELEKYYSDRKFIINAKQDLSSTLKDFYSFNMAQLQEAKDSLMENEKSYYKKLLNKISHESNVYLKLGGHKHIGFHTLLMQKEIN